MRILFVSKELIGVGLIPFFQKEGHEVRLFVQERGLKRCYDGMAIKTDDWKRELDWIGKTGLILFDDVGYGKDQDRLRRQGYRVIGGSLGGDRIESDRLYGQEIFEKSGIKNIPSFSFDLVESAIDFVKLHKKKRWVIKKNGGHKSALNYVGQLHDGSDVMTVLEHYKKLGIQSIHLQQRVDGVEVGVGRYFNGYDWVGPVEINIEHKSLMPNGIGPKTPEMGTLMWYESDEKILLFRETLAKLKPYLQKVNFRGDIEMNCIVSHKNVWPLEATARFGVPSTVLQTEIHQSPWGEFLFAVASGESYPLRYKKGYGITVTIAVPPFPFRRISKEFGSNGVEIFFHQRVSESELAHYSFEEVAKISNSDGKSELTLVGTKGCVGYVNGFGKTAETARIEAYRRVNNVVIPKMFYREDIGLDFVVRSEKLLKKWGWISHSR